MPVPSGLLASLSWQVNVILAVAILLLIVCSAFFSGSETAFTSVNNVRMKHYADEKRKGARKAMWIIDHYDITLSTILVGNNLVNIAATTICAFLISSAITDPTLSNILNTVVMTIVLLICGEITPKAFAKQNAEKVALRLSGALYIVIKILMPITYLFNKLQQTLLRRKKNSKKQPTVTEEELESIIDTMQEEGVLDSTDADLIQGVLDLDQKIVRNAMTHRVDVTAVEVQDDLTEIKQKFLDTQFSRLPVYENDIDHIVGILSEKDFFASIITGKDIKITEIMNKPMFVNEFMKLDDMIRQMQKEKKHIAVVLDEYGGTSGIITLEDAIEEVWGEIYDEHDTDAVPESFVKTGENTYLVDSEIGVEELFKKLEIEHLPNNIHSSLGAFLFELAEKSVPKQDQVLEFVTVDERLDEQANYYEVVVKLLFKLTKVENKRIRQVEITVQELDKNPKLTHANNSTTNTDDTSSKTDKTDKN